LIMGQAALAAPVVPGGSDAFGQLESMSGIDVDFGGSGIPTDSVVISTFGFGNDQIRLGIAATQRFGSPAVTNDGVGTYSATTGESAPGVSLWNFSFFAESTGNLWDAGIKLYYDFDPAANTDISEMGVIQGFLGSVSQDSQNLGFGFLDAGIPGFVIPPVFSSFDPFAAGEYSFRLEASNGQGVAMNVNVSPVPLPAALPLLLGALGGMGFVARRRRKS